MRSVPLLLILLILAACTPAPTTMPQEQVTTPAEPAATTATQETRCPFNICFKDPYVAHKYFTTTRLRHALSDEDCNEPFEEQYNESSYLCFIKTATPTQQVGADEQGNLLWEWRIECGCSYQVTKG